MGEKVNTVGQGGNQTFSLKNRPVLAVRHQRQAVYLHYAKHYVS